MTKHTYINQPIPKAGIPNTTIISGSAIIGVMQHPNNTAKFNANKYHIVESFITVTSLYIDYSYVIPSIYYMSIMRKILAAVFQAAFVLFLLSYNININVVMLPVIKPIAIYFNVKRIVSPPT
jgi:hypothetical protein